MTHLLELKDATGKSKEILLEINATFGMVPDFFKALAAVDADWLELNWNRLKKIMLSEGGLDHKTRELIALAVSQVNRCRYCSSAHETMARNAGATDREIGHVLQIVDLFSSFNVIVDSLGIEPDIKPE